MTSQFMGIQANPKVLTNNKKKSKCTGKTNNTRTSTESRIGRPRQQRHAHKGKETYLLPFSFQKKARQGNL